MRALVYLGPRNMELQEAPEPTPGPGEVVLDLVSGQGTRVTPGVAYAPPTFDFKGGLARSRSLDLDTLADPDVAAQLERLAVEVEDALLLFLQGASRIEATAQEGGLRLRVRHLPHPGEGGEFLASALAHRVDELRGCPEQRHPPSVGEVEEAPAVRIER